MQSRLAVLMVADLVGYSALMEKDEASTVQAVRSLKETHLEPIVIAHGGEVLKRMGDGWIIAFTSITATINCVVEIQNELFGHPIIKLRVGAHMGEIVEDDSDFYGAGINLAQRLETESPPGGMMISEDLYRQLTGDLASLFTDAGSFKLKNIALPVNGYQWRPAVKSTSGSGEIPTFAVELIQYAPNDSETESIAADLRDQLILRLARRTGVRVLDDGSGKSTGATYLLKGRLRISGDRGRLNIVLILREQEQTVLSQTYEGDTSNIFTFCDTIIEQADIDLRLQVNAFDGDRISHLPDDQLSVSELRSRAASNFYIVEIQKWKYGLDLLKMALALNPSDAMSIGMYSEFWTMCTVATYEKPNPQQTLVIEDMANKAIEQMPRSDYLFWARAVFFIYIRQEADKANRDLDRSLTLNPAYTPGHEARGLANLITEDYEAASRQLEKAVAMSESDPLLSSRLFNYAISLVCSGKPLEAINAIDRAIQLNSNERGYLVLKSYCYRKNNQEDKALEIDEMVDLLPRIPSALAPRPPLSDSQSELSALFHLSKKSKPGTHPNPLPQVTYTHI